MTLEVSILLPWITLLNLVFNAMLGISVWLRKPGEDAGKAVAALAEQLGERIEDHQQQREQQAGELWDAVNTLRTQQRELETHLQHMPNSEELAELRGTVQAIDERSKAAASTLARIEEFLYKHRLPSGG